jgi:hypothetical protein
MNSPSPGINVDSWPLFQQSFFPSGFFLLQMHLLTIRNSALDNSSLLLSVQVRVQPFLWPSWYALMIPVFAQVRSL